MVVAAEDNCTRLKVGDRVWGDIGKKHLHVTTLVGVFSENCSMSTRAGGAIVMVVLRVCPQNCTRVNVL